MQNNKILLAFIATVFSLGHPGAPASAREKVLEEIIVTAEKREERLIDTPRTVNVISGKQIADYASFELTDLDRHTAGTNITGGDFDQVLAVRGLATPISASTSPRTTIYMDGAFISQNRAVFVAQFDLERIELLRGPQGTLYGKTSPSGALVMHSRSPSLETFEGSIRQSVIERGGVNTQAAVSIPIVDGVLGLRLAGIYDENETQHISNITLDRDKKKRTSGGRAVLLWRPLESLSARLMYNHVNEESDDDFIVEGAGLDFEDRKAVTNFPGTLDQDPKFAVLDVRWHMTEALELTSISTYRDDNIRRVRDRDQTSVEAQVVDADQKTKAIWSQELRLASEGNPTWDWLGGLFYELTDLVTVVDVVTSTVANVNGLFVPLTALTDTTAFTKVEAWSAFLKNDFHLGARTDLSLGVRYNRERRISKQPFSTDVFIQPSGTFLTTVETEGIPPEAQLVKDDAWTGHLTLRHHLREDFMVYGHLDRAWRNGSANISSDPLPPELVSFGPETSHSVEAGTKLNLAGGRASVRSAAYYQLYDDFHHQTGTIRYRLRDDSGESDFEAIVNADEVSVAGVEIEADYLATPNWSIAASLSYTVAEFEKFSDAPCNRPGEELDEPGEFSTCDFGGDKASPLPDWSLVLASEYSRELASSGLEWFGRALFKTETRRPDFDVDTDNPGYGLLDLFAGLRSRSWEVSLWVKNALDRRVRFDIMPIREVPDFDRAFTPAAPGEEATRDTGLRTIKDTSNPRTWGMTASYRF